MRRSFAEFTKKGKEAWVEPLVDRWARTIAYRIRATATEDDSAIWLEQSGTKAGGRCLVVDGSDPVQTYSASKPKMAKWVSVLWHCCRWGERGIYLPPTEEIEKLAFSAKPQFKPETPICHWPGRTNVVEYGMTTFGDLFTDRQLVALNTFSDLVHEARAKIEADALAAFPDPTPLETAAREPKPTPRR